MRYCHVASGILIRFQISRSTGVPVATAFQKGSIILDLMIINFENAASHEYVVQNAKSL